MDEYNTSSSGESTNTPGEQEATALQASKLQEDVRQRLEQEGLEMEGVLEQQRWVVLMNGDNEFFSSPQFPWPPTSVVPQ